MHFPSSPIFYAFLIFMYVAATQPLRNHHMKSVHIRFWNRLFLIGFILVGCLVLAHQASIGRGLVYAATVFCAFAIQRLFIFLQRRNREIVLG